MPRSGGQQKLFDTGLHLPNGLVYRPDFITPEEEAEIIGYIEMLPLSEAEYGEYHSQRRHFGFGWGYDFERKKFIPGPPLPPFLRMLQLRIGKWLDIPPARVAEVLINEYTPGSPLGWHRDNEAFEHIVGISLCGWARMRFRPLAASGQKKDPKKSSLSSSSRAAHTSCKKTSAGNGSTPSPRPKSSATPLPSARCQKTSPSPRDEENSSLILNSRRGLLRDVVDDAVDAAHASDDRARNFLEKPARHLVPVGAHAVDRVDGPQREDIFIRPSVTHHTDSLQRQQHCKRLPYLFMLSGLLQLFNELPTS